MQDGEDLNLRWSFRDVTERRLDQEALRESEARFRTLAETAVAAILIVQAGKIVYANPAACETTGSPASELLEREFLSLVHPDFRADLQQQEVGAPVSPSRLQEVPIRRELRLVSKAGEGCWVDLTAGLMQLREAPVWVISAYDITRRVQVEQARTELLRRLVDAQEEERSRISRELHDQMGQSLSALILGLKSIEEVVPAAYIQRIEQMLAIADELVRETHQLALDLRPAALDDLGLSAALANYAEEWSERYAVEVDYQSTIQNDEELPIQAALAVYRIVQEALTNVIRHAQAGKVSLILTMGSEFENWRGTSRSAQRQRRPGSLLAIVEDDGMGFAVEELFSQGSSKSRLGLLGMKERAELLGGSLNIESAPGRGPAIFVRIPVVQQKVGGRHG
jgi:PAS domain S-box-containing protein